MEMTFGRKPRQIVAVHPEHFPRGYNNDRRNITGTVGEVKNIR